MLIFRIPVERATKSHKAPPRKIETGKTRSWMSYWVREIRTKSTRANICKEIEDEKQNTATQVEGQHFCRAARTRKKCNSCDGNLYLHFFFVHKFLQQSVIRRFSPVLFLRSLDSRRIVTDEWARFARYSIREATTKTRSKTNTQDKYYEFCTRVGRFA